MSYSKLAAMVATVAVFATHPLGAFAQMGMPPGGAMGPTEVGVMVLEETEVPFSVTLPGRAVAEAQTEIRPRVSGMIEDIVFRPGTFVQVGDVLFRLEADSYEAAHAAALAALASAEVTRDAAQATVDRYERLEGVGVTTSDLQAAQATLAQAKAGVSSAEAALQSATLDLDRVEVTSPIAGFADVSNVSVGAIVTANQTDALTTVTALDPIYVDVAESAARIARVRERIDAGSMQPGETLAATLELESGTSYDGTGRLVSPGVTVSTTTGAVDMRFEFDNPDRMILPGQFLRVNVEIGRQTAILVPQRAASGKRTDRSPPSSPRTALQGRSRSPMRAPTRTPGSSPTGCRPGTGSSSTGSRTSRRGRDHHRPGHDQRRRRGRRCRRRKATDHAPVLHPPPRLRLVLAIVTLLAGVFSYTQLPVSNIPTSRRRRCGFRQAIRARPRPRWKTR
ncbi:MAG: efflux RND transporter periplasmic adaptor subunit [Paracoccaceae bacterium]